MKTNTFSVLLILCVANSLPAQQMQVKQPNLTTFREDKRDIPPLLLQESSRLAVAHPEFGITPFNAQCRECVELIDKRTVDSRLFIDPKDAGHT